MLLYKTNKGENMNKEEIKKVREVINSMHKLREIQKIRKRDIMENKQSKATCSERKYELLIGLWATYPDMLDVYFNEFNKKNK